MSARAWRMLQLCSLSRGWLWCDGLRAAVRMQPYELCLRVLGGTLQASWKHARLVAKTRQASYEALAAKPNDYRGKGVSFAINQIVHPTNSLVFMHRDPCVTAAPASRSARGRNTEFFVSVAWGKNEPLVGIAGSLFFGRGRRFTRTPDARRAQPKNARL